MSTPSALQLFLNRLLMRSALTDEEQRAILSLEGRPSQARANVDIVPVGMSTDYASLVVAGLAGRFGQISDGRRQITALHIPGDMCDLHSLVKPKVGWALQAVSTTTLLRVPHTELRRAAARYPAIAEAFWRDCVLDASILSQWVVNVGRRDSTKRLSHLLCEMAVRLEQIGAGTSDGFEFDATQAQIADALGLTPVHVNRVMQALQKRGVIATAGRTIHILDWTTLAGLGEFESDYLELPSDQMRLSPAPDG